MKDSNSQPMGYELDSSMRHNKNAIGEEGNGQWSLVSAIFEIKFAMQHSIY